MHPGPSLSLVMQALVVFQERDDIFRSLPNYGPCNASPLERGERTSDAVILAIFVHILELA